MSAKEGRTLFSAAPATASPPSLISAASGGTINLAQGKLTYTRLHGTYSGSYTRGVRFARGTPIPASYSAAAAGA